MKAGAAALNLKLWKDVAFAQTIMGHECSKIFISCAQEALANFIFKNIVVSRMPTV